MKKYIIILLAFILVGCKTYQQTSISRDSLYHITIKTDSIYIKQVIKDSVYLHDSIFTIIKGDTIFTERWHTKYISKISHDTIWAEKLFIDTIYKSKENSTSTEQQLTTWQRFKLDMAGGLLVISLIALITMAVYIYYRSRK